MLHFQFSNHICFYLFLEIAKSSVNALAAIQDSRLLVDSVESFGTPGCGRGNLSAEECKEDPKQQIANNK